MDIEQVIKNFPDEDWNWCGLSCNPNITWDIVQDNPAKPWDWIYLSGNPNITWDIVLDNPDEKWDWGFLSYNKMSKHPILIKRKEKRERQERAITFLLCDKRNNNLNRDVSRVILGY